MPRTTCPECGYSDGFHNLKCSLDPRPEEQPVMLQSSDGSCTYCHQISGHRHDCPYLRLTSKDPGFEQSLKQEGAVVGAPTMVVIDEVAETVSKMNRHMKVVHLGWLICPGCYKPFSQRASEIQQSWMEGKIPFCPQCREKK